MKSIYISRLLLLQVCCLVISLSIACSQYPFIANTNKTQPPKTNTPSIDSKAINPNTASKLVTSKQVNFTAANSFIWLPGGQSILLANSAELNLFSLTSSKTSQSITRIQANNPTLLSVSYSINKIAWTGEDNLLHLWDIHKQVKSPTIGEGTAPVTGLSFARVEPVIAVAGYEKTISIWDVDSQQKIISWNTSAWLTELSFSPNNRQIAGVDLVGFSLIIFNSNTGEEENEFRWGDSASAVLYNALLSPDWGKVAWVSRGIVQIMDTSNDAYGPLLTHEDYVSDVAWAPNSLVIATAAGASVDGQFSPVVQLWDAQTGLLLKTLVQKAGVIGVDFSPDGHELAILLSGGILEIWAIE